MMTAAALTWSRRLDERRDGRPASARSQAQHPPAGTARSRVLSLRSVGQVRSRLPINSRDFAGRSSSYALIVAETDVTVFRLRRRRRRPARRR